MNANRTKVGLSSTERCSNRGSTSARATEKLLGCEKSHAKTIAWSYDMERHAKKCGKML